MNLDVSWVSLAFCVIGFLISRLVSYVRYRENQAGGKVSVDEKIKNLQELIRNAQVKIADVDEKLKHISEVFDAKTESVKTDIKKDIMDIKTDMKELLQLIIEIIKKK